jgi:5-methylthioadenosine/S-adenosylhomocysteine deaminase
MKRVVDTTLIHAHLFTMRGDGVGYVADGALAVDSGRIVAVDSTEALLNHFEGRKVVDAAHCVVLPGLINAHVDASLWPTG